MNVREIAEQSGVSVATVSRVLNGKQNVSASTRDKVMQAIRESGYDKKILDKNQTLLKLDIVVVILRDIFKPFLQELLCAFEQYSLDCPFRLMFYSAPGGVSVDMYMNEILRIAKGVIVFSSCISDLQAIERIKEEEIPVVVIDNFFADIKMNTLLVDNKAASGQIVNHLVQQNHKRIACLAGLPNLMVWVDRLSGYAEAMRRWNLFIHKEYIQYCEEGETESIEEAIDCLLGMDVKIRPTAIYCFNDTVAVKAVEYLNSRGLRVPEDISVAGFDCQMTLPRDYKGPVLTTIRQPFSVLAKDSLKIIEKELQMGVAKEPVLQTYDTELVIGESTGKAPEYK